MKPGFKLAELDFDIHRAFSDERELGQKWQRIHKPIKRMRLHGKTENA